MDNGDLRIRELAAVTVLDRSRLLAGRDGLDRAVARVVVRDVGPGTRVQVRDGDLVVARRGGMPGGGEGRELVVRLAGGGAAALAFVDGHYLPGALAGVRHAADEAGLPLFALPRGIDAAAAAAALAAAIEGGGAAGAAAAVRAGAALARAAREGGTPAIVAAAAESSGLGAALQDHARRRLGVTGRADARRLAPRPVPGGELVLLGSHGGVLAE